ncbi:MAG TPA: serine/threonine-protein kinase, partial [Chlamydiales bacterium]|nr:serine/threonine-protein kinase [Chlamydiales bacterium]
ENLVSNKKKLLSMPLKQRLQLFADICEGVKSMHEKGIVHLDLKPGNCLIKKGRAKITDFGTASEKGQKLSGAPSKGFHSTPIFTSHELVVYRELCNAKPYNAEKVRAFLEKFDPFTIDLSALGDILKFLYDGKPFTYMERLDASAAKAGLKLGMKIADVKEISAKEYGEQLEREIIKPLRDLDAIGKRRTPQQNAQYRSYLLIAQAKGISPFPPKELPSAASMFHLAQAAAAEA